MSLVEIEKKPQVRGFPAVGVGEEPDRKGGNEAAPGGKTPGAIYELGDDSLLNHDGSTRGGQCRLAVEHSRFVIGSSVDGDRVTGLCRKVALANRVVRVA